MKISEYLNEEFARKRLRLLAALRGSGSVICIKLDMWPPATLVALAPLFITGTKNRKIGQEKSLWPCFQNVCGAYQFLYF